jgi:hypothetical protein
MELDLPKGLISPVKAKELNHEFVKTRSKDLNRIVKKESGNPKKEDAISCWFSLDEIKKYIELVEKEAPDVNGLRVYFGAYGKKATEKSDTSTVFFVPTRLKPGSSLTDNVGGNRISDIDNIDALNSGEMGDPPSATYPQ